MLRLHTRIPSASLNTGTSHRSSARGKFSSPGRGSQQSSSLSPTARAEKELRAEEQVRREKWHRMERDKAKAAYEDHLLEDQRRREQRAHEQQHTRYTLHTTR